MDQTPNEQSNGPHQVLYPLINITKQNQDSLPQSRYKTEHKIQRQTPNQYYSQQPPSPINRAPMLPSQAQRVTPRQEQAIQNFGSNPQYSNIIQSQMMDVNSTPDKEASASDCEDLLKFMLQKLMMDQVEAVDIVWKMYNAYKEGDLIMREIDIDIYTIRHIKDVLDRYDNSLESILIRMYLSWMLPSFEFQAKEREIMSAKALQELSKDRCRYGVHLLIFFFEPTQEWLKALKGQNYLRVPQKILDHVLEATELDFVMKTLLSTRTPTFSPVIINQLMENLRTLRNEEEIMKNVEWVIGVCRKDEGYVREFIKKGFFHQLARIYMQLEEIQVEYMSRVTEFVGWMVDFKMTPEFVNELSRSGFFRIYDFDQRDIELTAKGYCNLYFLVQNISVEYPEQLKGCLRNSEWYQNILLKLMLQDKTLTMARLATEKVKQFIATDMRQYFEYLLERITDREVRQQLGLC